MSNLKMLLVVCCVVALAAGSAFGGEIHEMSKAPISKAPADVIIDGAQGLLDCSGAIEVDLNVGTYYGDNTGAPNNVSLYGCSTWNESGGEVVYHVTFPDDVVWDISIVTDGCDLDLALLDACDEDLGCIGVVDSGGYVSTPWPGEFYVVVDGYNAAACGYTLTFNTAPYVPVEFCSMVQDVNGGSYFTGDTCDSGNLIASMDCNSWSENGFEHYYEVFMPAGSSFTCNLVHSIDSAIWVLDACAEPFNCLAAADDNYLDGTETLTYSNASAMDTYVYLIIDSYGTDTCGTYAFDFLSTGGAVASEVETFGNVKAMFR